MSYTSAKTREFDISTNLVHGFKLHTGEAHSNRLGDEGLDGQRVAQRFSEGHLTINRR